MSYCRNNGEDSNVYVFGGDWLECCGCRMYQQSYLTKTYSAMIVHLQEHRKKGDKVPARAFARLKEEQQKYKDVYPTKVTRKIPKNVRMTKDQLLEQKLYEEMSYHRKELVQTALEVFEDIYKRKPHHLELAGLAKAADISTDLLFSRLLGGLS